MPDSSPSEPSGPQSAKPATTAPDAGPGDDTLICERCGKAAMYRMHAVWRCPDCGFKTDCCGW